ncbi:TRAP transporter permease [Pelagibacteraceae bacterium]|nr:TRAP transporter permease [Candidatus Pelagibacter bacterium]MDB2515407.1 TRAP transporter permease [Candidatus Pelagibacter bacterium]MDC1253388.1 TRAP transporter permease [Pelagibacteraceae bacterium]
MNQSISDKVDSKIKEDLSPTRNLTGLHLKIVASIAIIWSLFQLWYASPFPFWFNIGMFKGLPARAIHLGFALTLAFLIYPTFKGKKISIFDIIISFVGAFCCLYIYFFYDQLVDRGGVLLNITVSENFNLPVELILGSLGILILLEATRRAIGLPLVIIAVCFLLFSYFGRYAPEIISHGGLSLNRLVGFQWLDQEAIFGIPIGVSVDFIFLFVLFGALLETAGGGKYFLDLAFAMVGKMRGGPAKAAILGSGMTGLISGSSIANTVTTGTFTIPIMKKTGFSKEKAGAIEVSSSVNGQLMPPVMGAAAFVMASFIGVTYFEIVKHAFLPAIISYVALFYISHLEALKLNLKGMADADVPNLKKTFLSGIHFLIPIFVLIYMLVYLRFTASYSIFYATIALIIVNLVYILIKNQNFKVALKNWFNQTIIGFEKGALNMVGVGIAIATAGIIVGAVGSTGLSTNLIIVIESIAKDNVIILLFLTIILCLLLGMGLPTTANYVVVASLMATVLVDVGNASGFIFPLIAVHLFVFYFGLMADVTPPVGLASYAAAAISGGDPLKTGLQAFWYSLRTGILPIVFLFNHELLLIGIENIWHGLLVIVTSLIGILVFTSATQGWFINRLRWYEIIIFLLISISLLAPEFVLNKFYPKYNYRDINQIHSIKLDSNKEARFKVTRPSNYGERYKLFVIKKNTFETDYSLEQYGISLIRDKDRVVVDTLQWNGKAKKDGFETGDYISEFKIENADRPNKGIIYPIAILLLIIFGYFNARRKE